MNEFIPDWKSCLVGRKTKGAFSVYDLSADLSEICQEILLWVSENGSIK